MEFNEKDAQEEYEQMVTDAAEKRASANDRMKKGLKMLTRHAKNLQATLKREAAAKAAEEAKAARATAAARPPAKPEVKRWKLKVGSWKPEAASRKLQAASDM